MSKTVKTHWPDEVRLRMIEKSEFYSEPQVYQYGFYDGFQHAQSKTQELQEQNAELVNFLQFLSRKGGLGLDVHAKIDNLLTKHNHLKSNTNV